MRIIHLAGIVVDAENFTPVSGANIYDNVSGKLLTNTDENGYFQSDLEVSPTGEIEFAFKIEGENYNFLVHKEHWGPWPGNREAVYHIGLRAQNSESHAFSQLYSSGSGVSYESALAGLNLVKEKTENKLSFDKKIKLALVGNQDSFIEVDNSYYIVSDYGWIKINSKEDLISVNDDERIQAFKMNSFLQRKDIGNMSTTASKETAAVIYIRE
ncbi:hypothetical protein [Ascidiimonas sp. W6]|uniref:hypothetical protein n=1 Tax=Ascidiimonas meishanensis TaxID=3128903 RepID=UPI0030EF50ED